MPVIDQNHYTRAEELLPRLKQRYEEGASVNALSQEFDIRREAISTVLMLANVLPSTEGRDRVLEYVREHRGLSVDDLAVEMGMPKSTVSRYLRGTEEAQYVITRKKSDYTTYDDEQKKQAMLEAWGQLDEDQRSKGMSRTRYDRLVGHRADRPSSVTMIRRYGTWTAACEAAGITAAVARRSSYEREFESDEILDGINQFITETGKTSFHEYSKWAKANGQASGPLVVIRFRGWSDARAAAIKRAQGMEPVGG